jgi:hypothetical protein
MAYSEDGSGASVTLVVPPSAARPSPTPASTPTSTVTHPRPHLPFTGFDASTAVLVAVLLVALGALLLVRGRTGLPHSPRRT